MDIKTINKSGLSIFSDFSKYKNMNDDCSCFYPYTILKNNLKKKMKDNQIYHYLPRDKIFIKKNLYEYKIIHEFDIHVNKDIEVNIYINNHFNYIIVYQKIIIYINGHNKELSKLFFFLNRYNSNLLHGITKLVNLLTNYNFNDIPNITNHIKSITEKWNIMIKEIALNKRYRNIIEYNNYIKQNIIYKTEIVNLEKRIKRLKHSNNNIAISDVKYQKDFILDVNSSLTLIKNKINLIEEECKNLDKINKKLSSLKSTTCCILLPMYLFSIVVFTIITIIIKKHFIYTEL